MSAGLIIAIGAQNAFVLSQSIKKQHHLLIAFICSLLDALLIIIGILGLGAFITRNPQLIAFATWGGALFLFTYGIRSFIHSFRDESLRIKRQGIGDRRTAVLTTLAISLLNPHVYLDTVVLLGSIGGRLPAPQSWLFGIGAVSASFLWFFALTLGGQRLAPVLSRPQAWKILDLAIALTMWTIAGSLLWDFYKS